MNDPDPEVVFAQFKKAKRVPYTFGSIQLGNGEIFKYFIETEAASMVMIYGVRTAISE